MESASTCRKAFCGLPSKRSRGYCCRTSVALGSAANSCAFHWSSGRLRVGTPNLAKGRVVILRPRPGTTAQLTVGRRCQLGAVVKGGQESGSCHQRRIPKLVPRHRMQLYRLWKQSLKNLMGIEHGPKLGQLKQTGLEMINPKKLVDLPLTTMMVILDVFGTINDTIMT